MRRFLIATHRSMAKGIKDTVDFFTGSAYDIRTLSAYIGSNDIEENELKSLLAKEADDEIVIFTDLASGSVTQKFYPYLENKGIFLISGINLPAVLSIVLCNEDRLTYDLIDQLLDEAKEQLVQVKLLTDMHVDDE